MDGDDLAVVVLHHLAPHAPPADDELAASDGPEVHQGPHGEVGQAVVILRDEEAHCTVLASEGIVLSDVVEAAGELCHVDSFEMERVFRPSVGLTHLLAILRTRADTKKNCRESFMKIFAPECTILPSACPSRLRVMERTTSQCRPLG